MPRTLAQNASYIKDTIKPAIKSAIEAQGVTVPSTDSFLDYADRIGEIEGGGSGYQLKDLPTGAISTVNDATPLPLNALKISVEAWQEGSGTPSPSNIRPIHGWSTATIIDKDDLTTPTTTKTWSHNFTDAQGNPLMVYGAEWDVVNGGMKVTDGYIANYNGETLSSTWISDRDEYASGTTPTTGAEVVYKLATPTTIKQQAENIRLFEGVNNLQVIRGEYVFYDYIESNGTQALNLNKQVEAGDVLQIKFSVLQNPFTFSWVLGAGDSNDYFGYQLVSPYIHIFDGTTQLASQISINEDEDYIYEQIYEPTHSIALNYYAFGFNNSNVAANMSKARIYKITINGNDYLPCLRVSDGVFGLYDVENNTLLTDINGGDAFVGGNILYADCGEVLEGEYFVDEGAIDVRKVDYQIGSSGSIKTTDGRVLSGFASMSGYHARPLDASGNWLDVDWSKDFEIGVAFKTSSFPISGNATIFGSGVSGSMNYAPNLYFWQGSTAYITLSENGSSSAVDTALNYTFQTDTWYFVRVKFTKSTLNLKIEVSTDMSNFTTAYNDTLAAAPYHDAASISIGGMAQNVNYSSNDMLIDTFNTYIKGDGVNWGASTEAFPS